MTNKVTTTIVGLKVFKSQVSETTGICAFEAMRLRPSDVKCCIEVPQ